jgi:methionyl aminopeptidase
MDEEILEKYKKAGKISSQIREETLSKVKPGMKILELAEFIEKRTRELGAKPAFPVNIGINEFTAHYTPKFNDDLVIKEKDLVKIDQGIHIDGYVADTAYTYSFERNRMIDVVNKALEEGLKVIRPGVKIREIGEAIENVVRRAKLGVIVNLTGHGLDRYVIHGEPKIPNTKNDIDQELKEWNVVALEPFVTESNGVVKESEPIEIFSFIQPKPVRLPEARKILDLAMNEYKGLPFCKRWLIKKGFPPLRASFALKQLEAMNALTSYPVLKESRNKSVVQAEHTVIVTDPPIVTTR